MAKPKIAFILQDFSIGGIESCVYGVAEALRERFECYFIATHVKDIQRKFSEVGHPVHVGTDWRQLTRFLREQRFDLAQVHNLRQYGRCAFAAGVPSVVERIDGLRGNVALQSKRGYDAVIASNAGVVARFSRWLPRRRVHLIYNGISTERFDRVSPDRAGFTDKDIVIGRSSRFGRGKNLGMLIEAVKRLRKRYDHVRLVLVGDNSRMPGAEDMMSELREQAKPLGSSAVFTGAVESAEALIRGFDIATCVSRPQNEGIPNSLLEAMAAGKPVVATRVDNIPELVEHNVNGLLVESDSVEQLASALEALVQNEVLRRRLAAAGRRTIEDRFNAARQFALYGALYDRLIRQHAQGLRRLAQTGAWSDLLDSARIRFGRWLP